MQHRGVGEHSISGAMGAVAISMGLERGISVQRSFHSFAVRHADKNYSGKEGCKCVNEACPETSPGW
jgi:hypothetical protein